MVQNVSNVQKNNDFGNVKRVGETSNGRVIYQIADADGKVAGKVSIANKDCDIFEKSYRDIEEVAPKLQDYALKNSSPEKIEKKKKLSKRIRLFSTLIGFALPAILIKKGSTWKKGLLTLAGTLSGLIGGSFLAVKATTPPGAMKFAKATNNLNKIDIQPYRE